MSRSTPPGEAFFHAFVSADPDRTALIWQNGSLTFADLRQQADAVARYWHAQGLGPGDRVALLTGEADVFYACFTACLAFGFAAVIIDPAAPAGEAARMLTRAKPKSLVADAGTLAALSASHPAAVPEICIASDPAPARGNGLWRKVRAFSRRPAPAWPSFAALACEGSEPMPLPTLSDTLPAYVMFTSGTTSRPKAVVISRRALFRHLTTLATVFDYGADARMLHYLPLHHTDGLVHGPAAAIATGMTIVAAGAFSADAVQNLPQALRDNRITHFLAVPTMLALIRRLLSERRDLFATDAFCHLISTAGYLREKQWADFEMHFGLRVSNFYGMTETVSGTLYCGPSDSTYRRGSLGKPVDAALRIVADDGSIDPRGSEGELQIRGEHLMAGYLDDPDATSSVLTDGWLATGDLFRIDDDGFYHFVGRRKNIIKRGGITVYPEDIQKLIADLPGVREVDVVGRPDADFEETIVVCAVVETGMNENKIAAACAAGLAPERRPDRIVLLDSLPRGPSGKVQRDALIAQLDAASAATEKTGGGQQTLECQVIAIAADVFSMESDAIDIASTPESLPNWDSFAHLQLVLSLEKRFGIRLKPKDVMQLRSIGHAVDIVARHIDAKGG